MEKTLKLFNISCNCDVKALNTTQGNWTGKFVLQEDGIVYGIAQNETEQEPTSILVGYFIPEKGIDIVKINPTKEATIPLFFSATKNELNPEVLFGDVTMPSPLAPVSPQAYGNIVYLGQNSITINKANYSSKEDLTIQSFVSESIDKIHETQGFASDVLTEVLFRGDFGKHLIEQKHKILNSTGTPFQPSSNE